MDDLTPPHWNTSGPSLGGCHGAELTERLGVWAKEVMRLAESSKAFNAHIMAGNYERLSEDLRLAATRLAEVEAERDGLLHRIAEAMKAHVIEKMDECCEPCFQCNQNVLAIDTAALVKDVCDAE